VKIVADANIPLLEDAFGPLGDLVVLAADRITPDAVRDADALLVRSVTRVGAPLLASSRVRFVATATIGVDHVDQPYLASRGIGFASAEGSNARSVAEYVLAALLVLAARRGRRLAGQVLGVVGVGHVGGRVAHMAETMGMTVLRHDPPLARTTGDPIYVPLDALAAADIVTLHVPLTHEGPDATDHLVAAPFLDRLKRGATLLNTSRGRVAAGTALRAAIDDGRLGALVLDVWEGEPEIDLALLDRTDLATPHIAGYSFDGKVNGTRQVPEAFCRHFSLHRPWDPSPLLPPPARPHVALSEGIDVEEAVGRAVAAAYPIEADDARLRAVRDLPPDARGRYFSNLRRDYPVRREFPATRVDLASPDPALTARLTALGFSVHSPASPRAGSRKP